MPITTRDEYNAVMKRRKYVVIDGQVACPLCSGDCGQCGEGGWMKQCQDYLDKNKPSGIRSFFQMLFNF